MKIKIQVVIEHEDKTLETIEEEISCLQRGTPSLETLGLTLAESKELLANLQEQIVKQQVAEHVQKFQICAHCRQPRRHNGRQTITYRTLFGNLRLSGQRFYHCLCLPQTAKSFSPIAGLVPERTAPEFRYLQAKWASLKSYGLTVKLLDEVLPLSANVATTMRTTHAVAEKLENELGEEQSMFIEGPLGQAAAPARKAFRGD